MKTILYIMLCLLFWSVPARAQLDSSYTTRTFIIKMNLFSPAFNALNLGVEKILNEEHSVQINGWAQSDYRTAEFKYESFGILPEYRYIISDSKWGTYYIGACVRYLHLRGISQSSYYQIAGNPIIYAPFIYYFDYRFNISSVGAGVSVGKRAVFKNRIVFDYFIGVVYSRITESRINGISQNSRLYPSALDDVFENTYLSKRFVDGYGLRAGMTLGYKF